ncbi:GDSL-type esterase/lipase family protein, partial [uncultured Corynebacterium sp.]|uniref:GDSL-type esterase/lipase family protein n=1 Tax=uncultured Corynebacterium sp. TaxID=159447 RepID=UPI0025FA5D82
MRARHQTDSPASRIRRRITGAVVATVSAAALIAGGLAVSDDATPTAEANPGELTVFGDSYASNPDFWVTYGLAPDDNYPRTGGCVQAPNNWPRKLAAATGRVLHDWSCNGNTTGDVLNRIEDARNAGALTGATGTVAVAVGMNNYGPWGYFHDGNNFLDPGVVRSTYIRDMHQIADKIHAYAPNANIVMPGMLSISSNNMVCPLNVIPEFPLGLPVPVLTSVENWLADTQRDAAAEIGATFVDVKGPSAMHSTCSTPDSERYVAGLVDTTTPNYNFLFHPSDKGSQLIADLVKSH